MERFQISFSILQKHESAINRKKDEYFEHEKYHSKCIMMINNKHNAFYNLVSHWRHVCLTVLSMQQLRQLKKKNIKIQLFQGDQNRQWEPNFETKNGSVHYLRKTFIFFSSFRNFYDIIFYDFITHKFGAARILNHWKRAAFQRSAVSSEQ